MRKLKRTTPLKQIPLARAFRFGTTDEFEAGGQFGDSKLPEVPELPDVPMFREESEFMVEARRIWKLMGSHSHDWMAAQRIVGLAQKFPRATVPELLVYDFLTTGQHVFLFQQPVKGGRTEKGGLVPDFLVREPEGWVVWNVNGEYWHSGEPDKGRDNILASALVGTYVEGVPIKDLVVLWESDVYNRRPDIFNRALIGEGLRE